VTSPLVSVIILTHNRTDEVREAIFSIFAQDHPRIEVILLDNGSTDESPVALETSFPDIKLISLPENIGACAGRNRALEDAHGEFILQMDNDATLAPLGAISAMVARFQAEDDLGIIFTKIDDPATGRPYGPGYGTAYVDDEFYTWRFHGCAAMIRRKAIDDAGYYLPEEFFRAAEENDLAVRVLDAGYNILYMPSAVAHHKLSPKARDAGEITYLTVRNNLRVAWKFYPVSRALALTAWRPLSYLASGLAAGDLGAISGFFRIIAGQADALRRRRPVSANTMRIIDALTLAPAMTVDAMRQLRRNPPDTGFAALVRNRFGGRRP
jgi:GT2 family glycosyltransferase